jgi:hypothetical protein
MRKHDVISNFRSFSQLNELSFRCGYKDSKNITTQDGKKITIRAPKLFFKQPKALLPYAPAL